MIMRKLQLGYKGIYLSSPGSTASASYIYNEIFNDKIYENENVKILPGDVVVDVGGNIGLFSTYVLQQGANHVIAFEPDPDNIMAFLKNTNCYHNKVRLHPFGAWNESIEAEFMSFTNRKGSSQIDQEGDLKDAVNGRMITIDCIPIDWVCARIKVDFIKMDIEGSELKALVGAKETIKKYKPKLSISVYHKPEDPIVIPAYILSLVPEYVYTIEKSPSGYNEAIAKFYVPKEVSYDYRKDS